MKSLTMRAKMYYLGVVTSRSRPRVTNYSPYLESLFRMIMISSGWLFEGLKI